LLALALQIDNIQQYFGGFGRMKRKRQSHNGATNWPAAPTIWPSQQENRS
jgi:hypothetical protein